MPKLCKIFAAISEDWAKQPENGVDTERTVLIPSINNPSFTVALLNFKSSSPPALLGANIENEDVQIRDLCISIGFCGITQLYKPTGIVKTDIFVVCGPFDRYDSFTGEPDAKGRKTMFARDLFALDFPCCRTIFVAFDSKLDEESDHQICDYVSDLVRHIKVIPQGRKREKIIVSYGVGGLITTQAINQLMRDGRKDIVEQIKQIVFFDVPHRGQVIEDLLVVAEGRRNMVEDLKLESVSLENELRDFKDHCGTFKIKILTFRSTRPSRKLTKTENGVRRDGDKYHMIPMSSSVLGLPKDMETVVPVEKDHCSLVRISHRHDRTYQILIQNLAVSTPPGNIHRRPQQQVRQ